MREIQRLAAAGYISIKKHPQLPLTIFNYTHKTQFDNFWNEYTEMCRGLIIDDDLNIVSNSFPKFFNIGQKKEILPSMKPMICEKLDGSLGVQYIHEGSFGVASRGNFESDVAKFADAWLKERFTVDDFNPEWTYLYEVVFPENRIVVDYKGRSELVLIGVRDSHTGAEMDFKSEAHRLGLNHAKVFDMSLYEAVEKVLNMNGEEEEGYVLKYPCGYMAKLKSSDYTMKNRFVWTFNVDFVRRKIVKGQFEEMLEEVPDEYYPKVYEMLDEINAKLHEIKQIHWNYIATLPKGLTNKEVAAIVSKREDKAIIFGLLNGKDVDKLILKKLTM